MPYLDTYDALTIHSTYPRNIGLVIKHDSYDFLHARLHRNLCKKSKTLDCAPQAVGAQVNRLANVIVAMPHYTRLLAIAELARSGLVPAGLTEEGTVSRPWANLIARTGSLRLDNSNGAQVIDELLELFKRASSPYTMEAVLRALMFGVKGVQDVGTQRAVCETLTEIQKIMDNRSLGQAREGILSALKQAQGYVGTLPGPQQSPACPGWTKSLTAQIAATVPKEADALAFKLPYDPPTDKAKKEPVPWWAWALGGVGGVLVLMQGYKMWQSRN